MQTARSGNETAAGKTAEVSQPSQRAQAATETTVRPQTAAQAAQGPKVLSETPVRIEFQPQRPVATEVASQNQQTIPKTPVHDENRMTTQAQLAQSVRSPVAAGPFPAEAPTKTQPASTDVATKSDTVAEAGAAHDGKTETPIATKQGSFLFATSQRDALAVESMIKPRVVAQNVLESATATVKTTPQAVAGDRPAIGKVQAEGESPKQSRADASVDAKAAPGETSTVKDKPVPVDAKAQQMQGQPKDPAPGLVDGVREAGSVASGKAEQAFVVSETETSGRQSFVQDQKDNILSQVGDRLVQTARNGGGTIRMTLHPQSLGRLEVELRMQDGVMKAAIVAEDPAVRDVLMGQQHELRQSLEAQGLKLQEFSVSVRQDNGHPAGDGANQNKGRLNGSSSHGGGEAKTETAMQAAPVRTADPRALVDLMV